MYLYSGVVGFWFWLYGMDWEGYGWRSGGDRVWTNTLMDYIMSADLGIEGVTWVDKGAKALEVEK